MEREARASKGKTQVNADAGKLVKEVKLMGDPRWSNPDLPIRDLVDKDAELAAARAEKLEKLKAQETAARGTVKVNMEMARIMSTSRRVEHSMRELFTKRLDLE